MLKNERVFSTRSGGPGSASLKVFGHPNHGKMFTDGFDQFEIYTQSPLRHFPSELSERRITNLNYHLASKKEQHIFIRHEQKIRPWMVAGLDFGAMSSPGDFSRQLNTNRNFDIWFGFEAPSRVYRTYLSFTSNKIQNQENGGIASDSIFENASSLDTRTLPINLSNASIRHKKRDYFVKQDLNISRLFSKADSVDKFREFNEGSLVLSHSFWYTRKSVLFTSQNPDSNYFANTFYDTTLTYDSSFYDDIYNQAMLEYSFPLNAAGSTFSIGAGAKHQQVTYQTTFTDTSFSSLMGVVTAAFHSKKLAAEFSYSRSVEGDFDDSYFSQLAFDYLLNTKGDKAYLNLSATKSPQDLRNRFYLSNHFKWNNNFNTEERVEANAGLDFAKYKVGISGRFVTVKNMVFFREDYLPQVFGDYISFGEVSLTKIFKFGNFGMDDKVTLGFSGNENVVRLPDAAAYASIYYKNNFFKKALGFKAGVDVLYHTAFYNYGYMPATGVFYLQDEKKSGNYPMAGVFVALKIKSANLFIRMDHFNAGIGERSYYGAHNYPLPGRTIKFGVKWDLID